MPYPLSASTFANNSGNSPPGSTAWGVPFGANVTVALQTLAASPSAALSNWGQWSGFAVSPLYFATVPLGVSARVTVRVTCSATGGSGNVRDAGVYLLSDGTPVGGDQSVATPWPGSAGDRDYEFVLTDSQINGTTLTVRIGAEMYGGSEGHMQSANVSDVQIVRVFPLIPYNLAGGGQQTIASDQDGYAVRGGTFDNSGAYARAGKTAGQSYAAFYRFHLGDLLQIPTNATITYAFWNYYDRGGAELTMSPVLNASAQAPTPANATDVWNGIDAGVIGDSFVVSSSSPTAPYPILRASDVFGNLRSLFQALLSFADYDPADSNIILYILNEAETDTHDFGVTDWNESPFITIEWTVPGGDHFTSIIGGYYSAPGSFSPGYRGGDTFDVGPVLSGTLTAGSNCANTIGAAFGLAGNPALALPAANMTTSGSVGISAVSAMQDGGAPANAIYNSAFAVACQPRIAAVGNQIFEDAIAQALVSQTDALGGLAFPAGMSLGSVLAASAAPAWGFGARVTVAAAVAIQHQSQLLAHCPLPIGADPGLSAVTSAGIGTAIALALVCRAQVAFNSAVTGAMTFGVSADNAAAATYRAVAEAALAVRPDTAAIGTLSAQLALQMRSVLSEGVANSADINQAVPVGVAFRAAAVALGDLGAQASIAATLRETAAATASMQPAAAIGVSAGTSVQQGTLGVQGAIGLAAVPALTAAVQQGLAAAMAVACRPATSAAVALDAIGAVGLQAKPGTAVHGATSMETSIGLQGTPHIDSVGAQLKTAGTVPVASSPALGAASQWRGGAALGVGVQVAEAAAGSMDTQGAVRVATSPAAAAAASHTAEAALGVGSRLAESARGTVDAQAALPIAANVSIETAAAVIVSQAFATALVSNMGTSGAMAIAQTMSTSIRAGVAQQSTLVAEALARIGADLRSIQTATASYQAGLAFTILQLISSSGALLDPAAIKFILETLTKPGAIDESLSAGN